MADAPKLTELLKDAPSNWDKWGPDDEVGSLNYLTPTEAWRGAAEIRDGKVFTLQRMIGDPKGDPVWPGRTPAVREQVLDESSWDEGGAAPECPGGLHYADDKISAFLQGSTQYDALGHVWYDGKLWNGYDARTTIGGIDKASVAPIAERGVVGRGVLLDMARFRGKDNLGRAETFTHTDPRGLCGSAGGGYRESRHALMRNLGIALTELCDLEKLAADCAADGRYSFLYAAAPLKVHRASGSSVNPVVIK